LKAGWPFDAAEAARRQAAASELAKRTIELGLGVALDLVLIPTGEFVMGDASASPDERPLTRVRIAESFWMARTEISNEQFAQFDPAHDSHIESKTAYQFGIHGIPVDPQLRALLRGSAARRAWLHRPVGGFTREWLRLLRALRWLSEGTPGGVGGPGARCPSPSACRHECVGAARESWRKPGRGFK
jgi:hypothetical protein